MSRGGKNPEPIFDKGQGAEGPGGPESGAFRDERAGKGVGFHAALEDVRVGRMVANTSGGPSAAQPEEEARDRKSARHASRAGGG